MSREAVEKAIREQTPDWWSQPHVDHLLAYLDDPLKPDRYDIANEMWSMGAGPEHPGCPYGGDEPADADYQNECDTCQEWLLNAADKILAAAATEQEN